MTVIGVTPAQDDQGHLTINPDYMDAVIRAGGVPVLLPLIQEAKELKELLNRVDGLLLSGGPDIDPKLYGEKKLPECGEISAARDAMELGIFRLAMKRNMPVLGICRGIQVINAALGGTLYQDIASQMKNAIHHPCYDTPQDKVHEVTVTEDSLLYRAAGLSRFSVNSRHHQGIKTLGKGLVATAYSKDGLIEAVDCPQARFVTAVQWHPESLSDRYAEAQGIFRLFVEACRA